MQQNKESDEVGAFLVGVLIGIAIILVAVAFLITGTDDLCSGFEEVYSVSTRVIDDECFIEANGVYAPIEDFIKLPEGK